MLLCLDCSRLVLFVFPTLSATATPDLADAVNPLAVYCPARPEGRATFMPESFVHVAELA